MANETSTRQEPITLDAEAMATLEIMRRQWNAVNSPALSRRGFVAEMILRFRKTVASTVKAKSGGVLADRAAALNLTPQQYAASEQGAKFFQEIGSE